MFTSQKLLSSQLRIVGMIDRGGQNTINLLQDQNGRNYVSKVALTEKNDKYDQFLQQECEILEKFVGIKNIIQTYGMLKIENPFNNNKEENHLVIEHCMYGSLHQLALFTKPFDETVAFVVLRQVAEGLRSIHACGVVHLDLKENNILINFDKEAQHKYVNAFLPIEFKIADFGISKNVKDGFNQSMLKAGTPRYMAAEQFVQSSKKLDPFKIEIFSLGVTLFHLIFKVFPFAPNSYADENSRDSNFVQSFVKSEKNTYKIQISQALQDLLQGMLAYSQEKRYTLNQVMNSEWFTTNLDLLKNDKIVQENTRKSMFNKLAYVLNVTKVKIDVKSISKDIAEKEQPSLSLSISSPASSISEYKNQFSQKNTRSQDSSNLSLQELKYDQSSYNQSKKQQQNNSNKPADIIIEATQLLQFGGSNIMLDENLPWNKPFQCISLMHSTCNKINLFTAERA